MSYAKDEEFRPTWFELQDFGFGLFKDSVDFKTGFKELPKIVESDSYELNDFFSIFDTKKTESLIENINDCDRKIDFIGNNQKLFELFDDLDDQYFNGMLNEKEITISWSAALQKDKSKCHRRR